jgi:hypothetical protein
LTERCDGGEAPNPPSDNHGKLHDGTTTIITNTANSTSTTISIGIGVGIGVGIGIGIGIGVMMMAMPLLVYNAGTYIAAMWLEAACDALRAGKRLEPRNDSYSRLVEVHAAGHTKDGNAIMRVWQVRGDSVSG